jgi:CBS-domain-containing membrane protein
MMIVGAIAAVTDRPYIFPSLGPTAIMIFGHPEARTSAPRYVLSGHAIGAASGYFALWVMHLVGVPFSAPDVMLRRAVAAAIALALTALLMFAFRCEHAPAGATTLIIALGVLPTIDDFLWLMLAVLTLVILAFIANAGKRPRGTRF